MTRFLASVASVEEAAIALAGGADIVDLKAPAAGALGALPAARLRAIAASVGGRRPVSATVGDLPPSPRALADALERTATSGVDIVKVGLFDRRYLACLDTLAKVARRGLALVAVLFADRAPPLRELARLGDAGFMGMMMDTADKASGGLRRHLGPAALQEFVTRGRRAGLLTGLAGSLQLDDIPPLLELRPDYLGFRSALCHGASRDGDLDPAAVAAVRACIPRAQAATSSIRTAI